MASLLELESQIVQLRAQLNALISRQGFAKEGEMFGANSIQREGKIYLLSAGANPTDADADGVFLSDLGETFNSVAYQFGTVNNGVLQVGANTSGQLLSGAGVVVQDDDGITITAADASVAPIEKKYILLWNKNTTDIFKVYGLESTNGRIGSLEAGSGADSETASIRIESLGGSVATGGTANLDMRANLGGASATEARIIATASSTQPNIVISPVVSIPEISSPATPASGYGYVYFKTDSLPYAKNDAGTEMLLSSYGWPQSVTVFATEMVFSATATISTESTQMYGYFKGPSPANAADGDTIDMSFVVEAGTYNLNVLGAATDASGKIDGYIDGSVSTSWTGDDWYAGATLPNTSFDHSVTFAKSGRHTLRLKVNGKNGSSSDYITWITAVTLSKTSYTVDAP